MKLKLMENLDSFKVYRGNGAWRAQMSRDQQKTNDNRN